MQEIDIDKTIRGRALERTAVLFAEAQDNIHRRVDRLFAKLMVAQWLAGIAAALWISPKTWIGAASQTHGHVWAAIFLGGAIAGYPVFLAWKHPGRVLTRHVIAVAQMLTSALLIHLMGGRLETHFHVFGSLAFLAFYRDWRVLLTATVVVALDHMARGLFWPQSVFGVLTASPWRWLEHAGWVVFEDTFLFISIRQSLSDMIEVATRRANLETLNAEIENRVVERTAELTAAHRKLQASEQLMRAILESEPECVKLIAADGTVLDMNPAGLMVVEADHREQIIGQSVYGLLVPEHRELFRAMNAAIFQGEAKTAGFEIIGLKGTRRTMETHACPLRDAEGRIFAQLAITRDITARKNNEEELRRTQAFLNSVVENLPIGVFIKEAKEMRFVLWSKGNEELIGISRAEIMGKNDHDLFTQEEADAFTAKDRETLAHGHQVNVAEETIQTRHHGQRTLLTRKVPILGENGRPAYLLGISEDITERKQAEETLRNSEERFSSAFQYAPIGIALVAPDGRWLKVNRAVCELVGYAEAELLATTFQNITHPDDLESDLENVRQMLAGASAFYQMEKRYLHKSGRIITVLLSVSLVREAGQPLYFISQIQDITARKQAEKDLRLNEQRYRSLVKATTAIVWDTPASGMFEVDQPGWSAFTGQTFEELRGSGWLNAVHPDDQAETARVWSAAVASRGIYKVEHRLRFHDQTYRNMQVRAVPILAEDGTILGWFGVHTDITQRKRAEETLRLLSSAVEQSKESIMITDAQLDQPGPGILFVNPAFTQMTGYTAAEVIGATPRILQGPKTDRALMRHLRDTLACGEVFEGETVNYRKDGTEFQLEWQIAPIRNAAGIITHFVAIHRDITKRKDAEGERAELNRQFIEASRQAGMAEVATSVLHNVGNVLNSVNVSATLLSDQSKKSKVSDLADVVALMEEHSANLAVFITQDPRGRQLPGFLAQLSSHLAVEQRTFLKETEQLRKNVEHIKDIVSMQQSNAKVSGVTETLHVSDLVEHALRMNAGALMRHEVEVVRDYAEIPPVTTDKHKVLQVLVNLIRNAKYACDESDRVDKRMTVRVSNGDGQVRIAISDNGVGIPPENLTRIFNHGFTTRKEGHGFGLHSGALAAKEMGGVLSVQSDGPGQGAMFTLALPCL